MSLAWIVIKLWTLIIKNDYYFFLNIRWIFFLSFDMKILFLGKITKRLWSFFGSVNPIKYKFYFFNCKSSGWNIEDINLSFVVCFCIKIYIKVPVLLWNFRPTLLALYMPNLKIKMQKGIFIFASVKLSFISMKFNHNLAKLKYSYRQILNYDCETFNFNMVSLNFICGN